jgi:hypothetical protein
MWHDSDTTCQDKSGRSPKNGGASASWRYSHSIVLTGALHVGISSRFERLEASRRREALGRRAARLVRQIAERSHREELATREKSGENFNRDGERFHAVVARSDSRVLQRIANNIARYCRKSFAKPPRETPCLALSAIPQRCPSLKNQGVLAGPRDRHPSDTVSSWGNSPTAGGSLPPFWRCNASSQRQTQAKVKAVTFGNFSFNRFSSQMNLTSYRASVMSVEFNASTHDR